MADSTRVGPAPEQAEEFFEFLRQGEPLYAAAAKSQFSRRSMANWKKAGEAALEKLEDGGVLSEKERVLADFAERLEMAWDLGEWNTLQNARRLAEAGKGTWSYYMTLLQRTRPDRWNERRAQDQAFGRIEIVVTGRPARGEPSFDIEGDAEPPRALQASPSAGGVQE